MTPSCSCHSSPPSSMKIFLACKLLLVPLLTGWLQTSSASTVLKLNFCYLVSNPNWTKFTIQHLPSVNMPAVCPSPSACNLGFIFDAHLTFSDQIPSLARSCFYHIGDLRRIRPVLDFSTAHIIGTSLVHSKLDYCNSLYYGLPKKPVNSSPAYPEFSCPCCCCSSQVFWSWPDSQISPLAYKVQERIEYKIISTTYKVLQSSSPHKLRDIQPSRSTRSSSLVTLLHPQAQSSLNITNCSYRCAALHLWNKLPPSLRILCQSATSECLRAPPHDPRFGGFAPNPLPGALLLDPLGTSVPQTP